MRNKHRSPAAKAASLIAIAAACTTAFAQPAAAVDPGLWAQSGFKKINFLYFQGVTSDPTSQEFFFDGISFGLYATNPQLVQRAGIGNVIPAEVGKTELYNHIGDISFDPRDGGQILLPLESYHPGAPGGNNPSKTGAIGVADAKTLAWRYYVKLDPTEIPKAMWTERSPDGTLLWTSAENDLLAYSMDEINAQHAAPAAAPIKAVRRLTNAVPPGGITGAAFFQDRLFLAGSEGETFQIWSIDTNNGARRLEVEQQIVGESEGLDINPALGGLLHWQIAANPDHDKPLTYGSGDNALVQFVPRANATRPKVVLSPNRASASKANKVKVTVSSTYSGTPAHINGAQVKLAGQTRYTDKYGAATFTVKPKRAGKLSAEVSKPSWPKAKATLAVKR